MQHPIQSFAVFRTIGNGTTKGAFSGGSLAAFFKAKLASQSIHIGLGGQRLLEYLIQYIQARMKVGRSCQDSFQSTPNVLPVLLQCLLCLWQFGRGSHNAQESIQGFGEADIIGIANVQAEIQQTSVNATGNIVINRCLLLINGRSHHGGTQCDNSCHDCLQEESISTQMDMFRQVMLAYANHFGRDGFDAEFTRKSIAFVV
mmetsp:Transcript_10722/g.25934  ORF Transcript_10722/g.25934 Transcript_10722/m.25934 type:complete len:202 (-) Transcript_10722:986-1591(-)